MEPTNELFEDGEKRILFNDDTRFSIVTANDKTTLSGYAMIWGALSTDRGGFKVRLLPNSAQFASPTYALLNHSWRDMLAFTEDGSLRITNDNIGAKVEIDLDKSAAGVDALRYVERRMIKGMSFAMLKGGKYYATTESGVKVQNYESFNTDEVTITPIPAFEATNVQVKELADTSIEAPTPEQTKRISHHSKECDADKLKQSKAKLDYFSLWLAEYQQSEAK